jgi:fatty acid amide hydrolase 2
MSLAAETPFPVLLGDGRPVRPAWELAKLAFGRSDHTIVALLTGLTDGVPRLFRGASEKLAGIGHELRQEMLSLMGDDGIWLYPPFTRTAPRHGEPVWDVVRLVMPFAYTGIINILGFPATEVPLGLDGKGLPLGVQVISKPHADHVTIAVAMELERELGGWTPPPMATA